MREMIDRCKCEEANASDSGIEVAMKHEEAEEITRESSDIEFERQLTTTEFSVMDADEDEDVVMFRIWVVPYQSHFQETR